MKFFLLLIIAFFLFLLEFSPGKGMIDGQSEIINSNSSYSNDTVHVSKNDLWSVRMANSVIYNHPDYYLGYGEKKSWDYEQGLILQAFYKLYLKTNDKRYFDFIKNNLDHYIKEDGSIKSYEMSKFRLDDITPGTVLLDIYKATGEEKYKKAADTLRKQLSLQPRTKEGGFWHKEIYPHQMWLDGLFMAEPFYVKYAEMFNEPGDYDDIAKQFTLIYKHAFDQKTGLLYHGWDESKEQKWSNPETGNSPSFWSRAIGWYVMALVDVLDHFPQDHPQRKELIKILKKTCNALLKFQDKNSGVWYQVTDKLNKGGNYLEASGSCMFVYAFAKGAEKGYLNKKFKSIAENSFKGIINQFIKLSDDGLVNILHTCFGAGLGGDPYRDGSYEYYISIPQRTNDFKAIGPFILASLELNR